MKPEKPTPAPIRPRVGPFCPNCERGSGKHFPGCPLEGASRAPHGAAHVLRQIIAVAAGAPSTRVSLEGATLVERHSVTGKVLGRYPVPVRVRDASPDERAAFKRNPHS